MATQRIIPISLEEEMKTAYIDYSMSVIVSRALPDVRDGLKPVHRRVLYGMSGLGLTYNKSHKKSARIVGEVLGKYHPHGDSSVYDAMVRMAQSWSLRYPLVDGQGNFGSMDGDSPAAMRYTEAKMRRIADELITDIDKDTVDFAFNFDDTLKEPTVLPARIPNLLINGASGIAVGMATNMLPHNLTEVVNGALAMVDNPAITMAEICQHIKGPDFPTGGTIYGYDGVIQGLETGRGRVVVRGKSDIQEVNGREKIIINEIPFQVNKAVLVAKIAELVNDKKIEGISDIRDESDRNGLRIVVEIKRDAMATVVLSKLYKYTPLQTSYGTNNVALVNGRPEILNVKQILEEFVKFRLEVIQRRTQFDLKKAEERAHILEGLMIALDNLDAVIVLIRASKNPEAARNGLMETFGLSERQARAILDMRLQKLTGLERDKIKNEYDQIKELIDELKSILASEEKQREIIKEELTDIKARYGDERRTDINYAGGSISIEDLIADEDVIITISHLGYIKRIKSSEFRTQGRGGKGARASKTRDTDFVEHMFSATTHNYLLLFTEQGRCFWLRVYEIPEASKNSGGRVIQNILSIPKDDKVKGYIKILDLKDEEFINNNYIVFCTKKGVIKKTLVEAFSRPRTNGINALTIREGDQLLEVKLTNGTNDILIGARSGQAIRFPEDKVRVMGRSAAGVRGIRLKEGVDDAVVGLICIDPNEEEKTILVLSENGNGKRSKLDEYRQTGRGGKGVKTLQVTEKTGALVSMRAVSEEDDIMIINKSGISIRLEVAQLPILGRATQGVRVIKINKKDSIADIALIEGGSGDEENDELEEGVEEGTENPISEENNEVNDTNNDEEE
jgi:DNA gyrase subunit A